MITVDKINKHTPRYDPLIHLEADKEYSYTEFLKLEHIPPEDRVWVMRKFMSDKELRLFAVNCGRRALARVKNPDPRSLKACDVAEKFANGEASVEELKAANAAAAYAANAAANATAERKLQANDIRREIPEWPGKER